MKKFMRFASLFLALVLVFNLAVPAFALSSTPKENEKNGYTTYSGHSLYLETTTSATNSYGKAQMHCDDTSYRIQCSITVYVIGSVGGTLPYSAATALAYATDRSVTRDNYYAVDGQFGYGTVTAATGYYNIESSCAWITSV